AGTLSRELEPDTLTRLDAKNHPIGMHSLDVCVAEKSKRRLVETDCYLRYPPLQVFAGPQVERDTGPTPVIYLQLAGDVGLSIRIWSYVRFLAIRPDGLAQHAAGIVFAAHC